MRKRHAHDDFITSVCASAGVAKLGVFKLVWSAIISHIARRLIIDRKSIDLGWFILHPVPFRPSWKYSVISKSKSCTDVYTCNYTGASSVEHSLNTKEISKNFFNTDNMLQKDGVMMWSVEIEYKEKFFKYIQDVELQRLSNGKAEYTNGLFSHISKNFDLYHELLRQFIRQAGTRVAEILVVGQSRLHRTDSFPAAAISRAIHPEWSACAVAGDVVGPDSRTPDAAIPAYDEMPEMPDFQQAVADLRNPR